MQRLPDRFIFMKVGKHAGESFDDILTRKKREFDKSGMTFWGYGGQTCHPLKHVHPFVQTYHKSGALYLLMQTIDSKANPLLVPATEYSVDGTEWLPLPDGVSVTGSKYALILDEIRPGQLDFPTNIFSVATGKSEGKTAQQYLKGHVDKGCFVRHGEVSEAVESSVKKIDYIAKLQSPYSVFVR